MQAAMEAVNSGLFQQFNVIISTKKYRPLASFPSATTLVTLLGSKGVFPHQDDISLI